MQRVLIFSIAADVHADRVVMLMPKGIEAVRLNLDDPSSWSLSYLNGDVRLTTQSGTIGLDEILSVFVRQVPNFESFKKVVAPQYREYQDFIAHQQFALFSDCLAVLDGSKPFVNPLATASRAGKALQANIATKVGLLTPTTYMGADSAVAASFLDQINSEEKQACTKPIANAKVWIGGKEHTRFTEILDPATIESLSSLEFCPVIFQEYVPKAYEIRAAVIGDKIFAARIDSQSASGGTRTDWRRYDIPKTPHQAYTLPSELQRQILALQRRLGLLYSSFDFVRTPTGEYVFLETNPFGQWLWIEDLTGLPISKAIAEFLAAPSV